MYDAWGEGIGIYATDGAAVYGNTIHDCFGINIYLSQARNVVVDRNYLYSLNDAHNKSGWRATGITMATEPAPSGLPNPTVMLQHITLTNNVMVGTGFGILYFYAAFNIVPENTYQDLRISYNTIRAPQTTAILFQAVKNNSLLPSGVVVSDNIIETGGTGPAVLLGSPSAWSFVNNDWPGGVPTGAVEPGSFAADPRFVSPVLGGPVDGFRLEADRRRLVGRRR
ncbi:MAG TPA: right-handed parallel beta-helix repeat-containing protein [Tepidiformaceae bacterium]